jgi:hypothetical protein
MSQDIARRFLSMLLPVSCALAANACSSTTGPPTNGDGDAGPSEQVLIAFQPERTIYGPGHQVTPSATLFDANGVEVPDAVFTWSVVPEGGATEAGGGAWTLGGEGAIAFHACTEMDRVGTVCGERELLIDVSPPTVVVTSPTPGAEMLESEDPVIEVAGTISDENPEAMLAVFVNGVSVPVAEDGSFSTELTPQFGINHIVVEGRDGFQAPVEKHMDVMWAPGYLAPDEGTTGFNIEDALQLQIGQRFFDTNTNGTDLDLTTDPVVARDLASIVELVLWHMDLSALLEGGFNLGDDDVLAVEITEVTIGDAFVDVVIIDDDVQGERGLDLFIHLDEVFIGMAGEFSFGDTTLVIQGGLQADLRASARLTMALQPDGSVVVDVINVEANVSGGITPLFVGDDGPELNSFFDGFGDSFVGLINELLEAELIPTFTDALPALFEGLLVEIGGLLADLVLELDTGMGEPVTVIIDGAIANLDIVQGAPTGSNPGHITVRMNVDVEALGAPIHPDSRGAPQADAMPMAPFNSFSGIQLAVRQDFVNGLLHALWNAGLLEGDVSLGSTEAEVHAALPPVVRDAPINTTCRVDGVRCDVILQIGQLEVGAFGQRFGIHAEAGAVVSVADGQVSLAIQEIPEVTVWDMTDEGGFITPSVVRDLVIDSVWPDLFGAIGADLTIPLPLPNLGELGLGEFAPALNDATLDLIMLQRLDVASGYLGLSVDLELEAPQP